MKKEFGVRLLLIFLTGVFVISACTRGRNITVSYQMKDVKENTPSYQLSVWLEKPDGTFVKTLFVSEYLAYGGYLEYGVCPSWSKKAHWNNVTQEEFDAVTGATPKPGDVKLKIELSPDRVPDGEYRLYIQVHLTGDLNDTYRGKVKFIAGQKTTARIEPFEIKSGDEKGILSDIHVTIK